MLSISKPCTGLPPPANGLYPFIIYLFFKLAASLRYCAPPKFLLPLKLILGNENLAPDAPTDEGIKSRDSDPNEFMLGPLRGFALGTYDPPRPCPNMWS